MGFLWVALGGAAGAMGRYAISLAPLKPSFPVLTFITNVAGAVLIGFIVGIVESRENVSPGQVLFWKTGVCGGFTTFSTFSLETYQLFENKMYGMAALYAGLSVAGCFFGVLFGKKVLAGRFV